MGLFTSKKESIGFAEPKRSREAGEELLARGMESVAFPTQRIADLTPAELEVERQVIARLEGGPSELTQRGLDLTAAAAEGIDPLKDPTIRALIDEATRIGQEETGRVGRSVQIRGGLGSTTGRDELGRSTTATEQGIVAAASPLISQQLGITERARTGLIGVEEGLEANRLSLGGAVGSLRRNIQQSKFDASINKFIDDINFRFGTQARLLQTQLVAPSTFTKGGGPSEIQKVTGAINQLSGLSAAASGFGSQFGGGGNIPTGGGAQTGQTTSSGPPNISTDSLLRAR